MFQVDIKSTYHLLTFNKRDELRMHDLLQDMGKHSRLWVPEEICYVLHEDKGTEAIEVIMLPYFEPKEPFKEVSFAMETLRRMSKLRFLYLDDINLTGKFDQTLKDLRWFFWDQCPLKCLPSNFSAQKLVILELPHSKMTTLWEVNMVSNVFNKLKTLNMSFSRDLTTTPDFGRLPCLKYLYLEGCTSLKEVHISIGSLVSLVSLNLKDCVNLRSLPDSICNLRALEVLCIEKCRRLEALPVQLGKIESLTELNASRIKVSKLPDSIGYLSKVVKLNLGYNKKLEFLPNTICKLRALEVLRISVCTNVKALPDELGEIESLRELHAEWLTVSKLPDSIGYLSKLVKLNLGYNKKLESLPNTICKLRALEFLSIKNCIHVEALPVELGSIESLRELQASEIPISKLPDSICNMRSLEILDISDCRELERLPDQLWKLTKLSRLHIKGATLLNKLPDIESSEILLSLTQLDLSGTKITALPSGISRLSNLEQLHLRGCGHLLSVAELPPNLTHIYASDCTSLKRLNLSNLKLLRELDLTDCSTLTQILGLGELTSLEQKRLPGYRSSLERMRCYFRFG